MNVVQQQIQKLTTDLAAIDEARTTYSAYLAREPDSDSIQESLDRLDLEAAPIRARLERLRALPAQAASTQPSAADLARARQIAERVVMNQRKLKHAVARALQALETDVDGSPLDTLAAEISADLGALRRIAGTAAGYSGPHLDQHAHLLFGRAPR